MNAWAILQKQIKQNSLSHAYLLLGYNFEEKRKIISKITANLKINLPDIIFTQASAEGHRPGVSSGPEGKIGISEIRTLQHQINLKPHSSLYKIAVISNADNLTAEAANALLKTLEEPPKDTILILFSQGLQNLFPTIISRCQKIVLPPSEIAIPEDLKQKYNLKSIFQANLKDKFEIAKNLSAESNLNSILNYWLLVLRKLLKAIEPSSRRLLKGKNVADLILKIWQAQNLLKTNVNKILLLENLFLEMHNEKENLC